MRSPWLARVMLTVGLASAALALPAFASMASSQPAGVALPLSHAGRWLIDARGRVVILHGTNMVYKLAPFYPAAAGFGKSDAAFLRSLGFDAVRVGVLWQAVEPKPGVFDRAYLNHIADTVNTLARDGIVSLLDFHQDQYNQEFEGEGFPTWSVEDDGLPNTKTPFPNGYEVNPALQRTFENFWADKPGPGGVGLQERYAAAWEVVARRFRNDRSVLGFEIMNEPFPGSNYLKCAQPGCPASDAQLTALERKVDRAIRKVDKRTLVFQEPYVTFNFGYKDGVGPLQDRRAVFAWHNYCLTNEADGCSSHKATMQNAARYVAKTGEGTMMTEFGATTSKKDLDQMVALADRYMVPWTEWAYCTCGDPTGSSNEGMVLNPRRPKTASNLRPGIIKALVEPYPQLVSGTPLSWGFGRSTKTFHLKYTTARASGHRRFPAGSLTQIEVPDLVYRHGYAVRADGAAIVSEPHNGALTISSCPGVKTVRVTITPAGHSRGSCRA
jgi:endoglycosylceramidase